MTEEQMDKLAEIVAVKVMDKLIAKQKEWDKQFEEQMKNPEYFEGVIPAISEKEKLRVRMSELIALRAEKLDSEEYELLIRVEAELVEVSRKFNNLP